MNITQTGAKLSIISTESVGYRYVHVVQDVTIAATTIVSDEYTDSISYYTLPTDGYYIVTEMKIPTTPGDYYYIVDDVVFNADDQAITISALMEVDTIGTSIVRVDEDYISMYHLEAYYLSLLKSKYLANICNCGCGCIDKQDKIKLDTLTMGLDLIEALLAKVQYHEVQRIVEKLSVCFGLMIKNCNCY